MANRPARIRITDDWFLDQVSTLEDCEKAYAELTVQIVGIELRISDPDAYSVSAEKLPRLVAALRFKKAALQGIQNKRGDIRIAAAARNHAASQALLREFHTRMSAEYKERHPEEFAELAYRIHQDVRAEDGRVAE